jgi:hypothetical protein
MEDRPTNSYRIFYFLPYLGLDPRCIKVLDITHRISAQHSTKEFRRQAKEIAICRSSAPSAFCTLNRRHFRGHIFDIESPPGRNRIAKWNGGWTSANANVFTFSQNSRLGRCPITIEAESLCQFREQFVLDSSKYVWTTDDPYLMKDFTLEKSIEAEMLVVGQFSKLHSFRQGGVLILNTNEIDPVLGVVTCASVLRKRCQRIAEISN